MHTLEYRATHGDRTSEISNQKGGDQNGNMIAYERRAGCRRDSLEGNQSRGEGTQGTHRKRPQVRLIGSGSWNKIGAGTPLDKTYLYP